MRDALQRARELLIKSPGEVSINLPQEARSLPVSSQNGRHKRAEDGAHGPFETRPELWQGRNYGGVRWVLVFNCSSNIAEVHGSTGSSNWEGSLFYVQHGRKRP